MAKAEASVEELVSMIERGELRLPEMQRRYVWRSTRVRDLLDSLYRGYPSGAILVWETDEAVPLQEFAVEQQKSPYQSTRLLLDGQQRLTSLSAVIRGESVSVRGRKRPIDLLFNLEHPDQLALVTEVDEDGDDGDDDEDRIDDEADSSEDELQKRFDRMTFVWVLVANAKGRYSRGSSETLLDQDLATLRDGGGANDLIDRLRLQVGRLDIAPEELEGRNQRSALFKTMFLAFRAAGAKDWRSNLTIALDHSGSNHRLQFHHIFPKAVLKSLYTPREADDIANLAFISGKTNRQISDKQPAKYFPPLIEKSGSVTFEAQCIPIEPSLLVVDAYKNFLAERRIAISHRLNEFIKGELS